MTVKKVLMLLCRGPHLGAGNPTNQCPDLS